MTRGVTVTIPQTPASTGAAGLPQASAYWGSVNGARVISGSLSMPLYGAWVADLVLESAVTITSPATVAIGNLTLVGTVYRQASFAGRLETRIVAGGGGWSKSVQPRAYDNPAGVPKSQILTDAATEVGETIAATSADTVGAAFVRFGDSPQMPGKASRVLRSVAGTQWWIDAAGVTHIGPRLGGAVASDFTVESFHGAPGTLSIATEDPASWTPGASFSSPTAGQQTIASVRHVFDEGGKARLEVMISGGNDRWIEDLREMIRQEVAASLPYAQVYEYVVTESTGASFDGLPVDQTRGIPPITSVPFRAGVPGVSAFMSPGTHVVIGFLDGNPGKPYLAGGLDTTAPLTLEIDANELVLGDATAMQLAKATPILNLNSAIGTWSVAVSGALSSAGFPIAPAQAALVAAIVSAATATPTLKVFGT